MITCYGEALVDLIVSPYSRNSLRTDSQACLGGSVFNFCIAAQRQGVSARYLNALSSDSFGRQFAHILESEGVTLDAPKPCPEPTSIAVVQLDAQGKATYAFHRNGVADTARSAPEIVAAWPSGAELLHTGCLMLMPSTWPQTQTVMAHARAQGCVISVDANLRPAVCPDLEAYRSCVLAACAMAHVVKVSDDDLITLGWLQAGNSIEQAEQAAMRLLQASAQTQLIALTLGERGASLIQRHAQCRVAAPAGIEVKDTVGAGDSFFAALLAWLIREGHLSEAQLASGLPPARLYQALHHAIAAASICVQRVGCDPASWQESLLAASTLQTQF